MAGDFQKFSEGEEGGWGNFGPQWGWPLVGLQSLGGAEDFDEFCKNVMGKFSKIE